MMALISVNNKSMSCHPLLAVSVILSDARLVMIRQGSELHQSSGGVVIFDCL